MSCPFINSDAWTLFGVGIGQSEIIASGIALASVLVLGYRLLTRSGRYGR